MENIVPDSPTPDSGIRESPRGDKRRRGTRLRTPYTPVPRPGFQPARWLVDVDGPTIRGRATLCLHSATVGKLGATTYHGWVDDPSNPCKCGAAVYGDLRIGLPVGLWVSLGGGPPRHHTLRRVREERLPPDALANHHNTDTHAATAGGHTARPAGVSP